jgi:hypothetical protein
MEHPDNDAEEQGNGQGNGQGNEQGKDTEDEHSKKVPKSTEKKERQG